MRKQPDQFPDDVLSSKKQIVTSSEFMLINTAWCYIPCIDIMYIGLPQMVEMEERSTDVIDIEMSDDSEWIDK